ncbi:hypothetical protein [Bacillus cereus]|uniref:hypothetical protein n=1 Tax=Bacillus cereus TaxID=1396 RepID=UPI0015D515A6|nr:hypothetical protein [Bacillus cereus]
MSELLEYAIAHGMVTTVALIELLVVERQVLTFTDDVKKLDYYFQDRYRAAMNQHVRAYMEKKKMRIMSDREWQEWIEKADDRYFAGGEEK